MYQTNDDIAALATLSGRSALNVIRVSGKSCMSIYKKTTGIKTSPKPNLVKLCCLKNPRNQEPVEQAMVTFFKGPKSFTGEDCLEFSVHGGSVVANKILNILYNLGVREAMPGEFAYRAFINNKIDVLQAEAINALIESDNDIDGYYSLNSLFGGFSKRIKKSLSELKALMALCEHELDFSEEEITLTSHEDYLKRINLIRKSITKTLKTSYTKDSRKSCTQIAIIGKPNAGKSSLFNLLIGRSKSIVTNIEGTTRDILDQEIYIEENLVKIIDTAGIRDSKNKVEKIGIKRSLQEIEKSDIILIIDEKDPRPIYEKIKKNIDKKPFLLIRNKIDLCGADKQSQDIIRISCKNHQGISKLITTLSTIIKNKVGVFKKQYLLMLNARQEKALLKIEEQLKLAYEDLKKNKDLTLCLSILYGAMEEYNTLIRPVEKNEILNEIFGGFCVGK